MVARCLGVGEGELTTMGVKVLTFQEEEKVEEKQKKRLFYPDELNVKQEYDIC